MENLTYAEIIQRNRELGRQLTGTPYRVCVLSNIVVLQIKEILEYYLRVNGINATVSVGNYDNIVQDSISVGNDSAVVVFWEPSNLLEGLQYKADLMTSEEMSALTERLEGEIALVLENCAKAPLVIFNALSTLPFTANQIRPSPFASLAASSNQHLRRLLKANVIVVDTDSVLAQTGLANSIDLRLYNATKSLYTTNFFCCWAEHVLPVFRSASGKSKKALILDCDNTLWKGIVGEDGFDGISMSPDSPAGKPFSEVQSLIKQLQRQGVLVGLCSKNNPEDVFEVLDKHPDMILRREDIAGFRINWDDKATNIRALVEEWNIGMDSVVFVDDSDFELGLVREVLPEVITINVPSRISEYPQLIRSRLGLFFQLSVSEEDKKKTLLYQQERARVRAQAAFTNVGEYLRCLELKLVIHEEPQSITARLAQMTQKTNQFNLTTRRYTEADIGRFLQSDHHIVLAFAVSDKFGEYGITGEAIVEVDVNQQTATIDTLLLSCRVLGRNVEFVLVDELIRMLRTRGIAKIQAEYLKTPKNALIADYLDRAGFELLRADSTSKRYSVDTNRYLGASIDYVVVEHRSSSPAETKGA